MKSFASSNTVSRNPSHNTSLVRGGSQIGQDDSTPIFNGIQKFKVSVVHDERLPTVKSFNEVSASHLSHSEVVE